MLKISKENEATIKELISIKASTAKIKGATNYLSEGNATDLDVREYLASIGYASIRATNFISDYYARLEESELPKTEFNAIINAASANVIKHVKHYDNIRMLCNKIRQQAVLLKKQK